MGNMGGIKNLKVGGIKGARYTVMENPGKNLQQNMYPKPEGSSRFMPRTLQRGMNLKNRALHKEKQYAEHQQMQEMLQQGEKLPKDKALR